MYNLVDKRCVSTEWFTPPEILAPVRDILGDPIPLDPCTTEENPTKACRFFTPVNNGLIQPWGASAFVNPPYGRELYSWVEKVVLEASLGVRIILLVSASSRWDQERWQKMYSPELTTFLMIKGRVKFLSSDNTRASGSPPYPSVMYFYNLSPDVVADEFGHMGTVVEQKVRRQK